MNKRLIQSPFSKTNTLEQIKDTDPYKYSRVRCLYKTYQK